MSQQKKEKSFNRKLNPPLSTKWADCKETQKRFVEKLTLNNLWLQTTEVDNSVPSRRVSSHPQRSPGAGYPIARERHGGSRGSRRSIACACGGLPSPEAHCPLRSVSAAVNVIAKSRLVVYAGNLLNNLPVNLGWA